MSQYKNERKRSSDILYDIVKMQHGVFTARQAIQAGYDERNHIYHVKVGNWVKERRGIYRLKNFPYFPTSSQLSLWSLWSSNKRGEIQGVYSHETALQIYVLSDILPSRLHMTVPKNFRRGVKIPDVLVLYKEELESSEWQTVTSFRVTTPTRTIYDVIFSQSIPKKFITQAVVECFSRELFSISELKRYNILETVNEIRKSSTTFS